MNLTELSAYAWTKVKCLWSGFRTAIIAGLLLLLAVADYTGTAGVDLEKIVSLVVGEKKVAGVTATLSFVFFLLRAMSSYGVFRNFRDDPKHVDDGE